MRLLCAKEGVTDARMHTNPPSDKVLMLVDRSGGGNLAMLLTWPSFSARPVISVSQTAPYTSVQEAVRQGLDFGSAP
jgi:hypothetical protein